MNQWIKITKKQPPLNKIVLFVCKNNNNQKCHALGKLAIYNDNIKRYRIYIMKDNAIGQVYNKYDTYRLLACIFNENGEFDDTGGYNIYLLKTNHAKYYKECKVFKIIGWFNCDSLKYGDNLKKEPVNRCNFIDLD